MTNDKTSTLEHLLQAINEITTRQGNLQVLMVEVFKIINGLHHQNHAGFHFIP